MFYPRYREFAMSGFGLDAINLARRQRRMRVNSLKDMECVMRTVNIAEATASFEKLMTALEEGREHEVIITKEGRPVAGLVSLGTMVQKVRFGVAKGMLHISDDFDAPDTRVAKLFDDDGTIEPHP